MAVCIFCGKEITNDNQKYCSRECRLAAAKSRKLETCKICGKALGPLQISYCSKECQRQAGQLAANAGLHPCPICGGVTSPKQKYCSKACYDKALSVDEGYRKKTRTDKVCVVCGAAMENVGHQALYCSKTCQMIAKKSRRKAHCEVCGKKLIPRNQFRYCSEECFRKAQEQDEQKKQHECPICGKMVVSGNKYCSSPCQHEALKRKAAEEKVARYCEICGKQIESGQNSRFCSSKCNGVYTSRLHQQGHFKEQVEALVERIRNDPRAQSCPEHYHAKLWTLRSPEGKVYQFRNLTYWAKQNAHLFDNPDYRTIKSNFYTIRSSMRGRSKTKSYSYKGWTILDCED